MGKVIVNPQFKEEEVSDALMRRATRFFDSIERRTRRSDEHKQQASKQATCNWKGEVMLCMRGDVMRGDVMRGDVRL
jgi:hypothetical protein